MILPAFKMVRAIFSASRRLHPQTNTNQIAFSSLEKTTFCISAGRTHVLQ
jgi:hypothetical protein